MKSMSIASAVLLLFSTIVFAAEIDFPLTEYGQPDLRGVWNFSSSTPFERPEELGNTEFLTDLEIVAHQSDRIATWDGYIEIEEDISSRIMASDNATSVGSVNLFWGELFPLRENTRTSVIVHPGNGRIPPVQEGVVVQRGDWIGIREIPGSRPVRYTHGGIARNGPEDRGLSERCLVFNSGPPIRSGPYNNNIQIFQNSDHVVILTEMGFDARIVPLSMGKHIHEDISLWSGDSRGHFEGNTLVVETRNFTNQIASLGLLDVAYGSAKDRFLVERFTPTSIETLDYEFTIDDPATFTDRIVGTLPMTKIDTQIYEYACHEGNYAIANILSGASAENRTERR